MFDAFVPFSLAAFPAAFFIACGRPNQERSPLPIPPVLLLLTGDHQEEGDRGLTRGMGPLKECLSVFLRCGRKTLIVSGIHSSPGLKTFGETGKKAASRPARNALWGLHGEDH